MTIEPYLGSERILLMLFEVISYWILLRMHCFLFRMASVFLLFQIIALGMSAAILRLLKNSLHKLFIKFDYLISFKGSSVIESS